MKWTIKLVVEAVPGEGIDGTPHAAMHFTNAYELRGRASEWERLPISAH